MMNIIKHLVDPIRKKGKQGDSIRKQGNVNTCKQFCQKAE